MKDTGISIRPFRASDQAAARRLILAGLGEHFGLIDESRNPDVDDIQRRYVDRGAAFLIAEREGAIAGTAALICEEPGTGRVVRVSVAPEHRRQGIARALVTRLLEEARNRGFCRVVVETNLDWYDAIGLYEALGFREYGRDAESRHLALTLT